MNLVSDFIPNRADTTNDVIVLLRFDCMIPRTESMTDNQTKRLGDVESRSRLYGGQMEIQFYFPAKRDHLFEPYVLVGLDGYPSHYISSRISLGVTCRPLRWSFGVSSGKYYRHVASDGNFITRRSKMFDTYPLWGAYMQTSQKHWTFLISNTFELNDMHSFIRATGRLGHLLVPAKKVLPLRSLEVVLTQEMFTGYGAGISFKPVPHVVLEGLVVMPEEAERDELARIGYKVTDGWRVGVRYYVQ